MKKVRFGSRPSPCEIMFLSFLLSLVHSSLLLPFFYAPERVSVQGSISRCILFVRECVTHNTAIFVFFYSLQSEAPDIFDYSRAEIAVYRGIRTRLPSALRSFIFLRNYVIEDDNLPLRL